MTETTSVNRPSRLQALIKVLEVTSAHSAKAITYTTALLGMMALMPNVELPSGIAVLAGGLGANAISSLLDHVARSKDISDKEIQNQVELAIAKSGIEKLLTKDSFFHALSQLLKHQRNLENASDEILKLLHRIETNIIPTISGISYADARQIAQDVFDANFYRLAGEAHDLARSRSNEFIECLIGRIVDTLPNALTSATDPDYQYVLFLAQQTYARTGDQDALDVLVNLLVERASTFEKPFLNLAQNEAIAAIPKLNPQHYNALSILFLVKNIGVLNSETIELFIQNFRKDIRILVQQLPTSSMFYEHLELTGCVTRRGRKINFNPALLGQIVFDRQFEQREIDFLISEGKANSEFFESIYKNSPTKKILQKMAGSSGGETYSYPRPYVLERDEFVKYLRDTTNLTDREFDDSYVKYNRLIPSRFIDDLLSVIEPDMAKFLSTWKSINGYSVTPVGLVIAISNLKRITGYDYNVLHWFS